MEEWAEIIGVIFGAIIVIGILGYFFPMVALVIWGIVTLIFAYFALNKDMPEEPDNLGDRLSEHPKRIIAITVPLCFFLGYLAYYNSDSYAVIEDAWDRAKATTTSPAMRDPEVKQWMRKNTTKEGGRYYYTPNK